MTTQTEGKLLKDTYERFLRTGGVARYRQMFRDGNVVRVAIYDQAIPKIDPGSVAFTLPLAGQYQLRYFERQVPACYGVWGRMDSSTKDSDWVPVEGPWPVDNGPFDSEQAKTRYAARMKARANG